MSPERVAAIDCGTNSLRLLVLGSSGEELLRRTEIVRLGQDVDRTGRLASAALSRTRRVLVEYAELLRTYRVHRVRMVATSATRDAANRAEFSALVREVVGVEPQVIGGQEEAELSFAGAVGGLPRPLEPVLVADVGGGSTELVIGSVGADARWTRSIDIGSVRLTERHLRDDPPAAEQVAACVADIRDALAQLPPNAPATVIGVGGTVTTLAAVALQRPDAGAVHGVALATATIDDITDRLLAMTHAERAAIPQMHPGRADVIAAGALIVRTLLRATGAGELSVSVHDILDGIAWQLLAG